MSDIIRHATYPGTSTFAIEKLVERAMIDLTIALLD